MLTAGYGQAGGPGDPRQGEVRNLLMVLGGERELQKGPALEMTLSSGGQGVSVGQRPPMSRAGGRSAGGRKCTAPGLGAVGVGGAWGGKDGAPLFGTLGMLSRVGGHGFGWEGMPHHQGACRPAVLEQVARGSEARQGGGGRGAGLRGQVGQLQARAGLWVSGRPPFVWLC